MLPTFCGICFEKGVGTNDQYSTYRVSFVLLDERLIKALICAHQVKLPFPLTQHERRRRGGRPTFESWWRHSTGEVFGSKQVAEEGPIFSRARAASFALGIGGVSPELPMIGSYTTP